jgi:hypothetical protein
VVQLTHQQKNAVRERLPHGARNARTIMNTKRTFTAQVSTTSTDGITSQVPDKSRDTRHDMSRQVSQPHHLPMDRTQYIGCRWGYSDTPPAPDYVPLWRRMLTFIKETPKGGSLFIKEERRSSHGSRLPNHRLHGQICARVRHQ